MMEAPSATDALRARLFRDPTIERILSRPLNFLFRPEDQADARVLTLELSNLCLRFYQTDSFEVLVEIQAWMVELFEALKARALNGGVVEVTDPYDDRLHARAAAEDST